MRKQILAGAMVLAACTTSAMAFDHAGGLHTGTGAIHGGSFAANRMAGVRGYSYGAPTAAWAR